MLEATLQNHMPYHMHAHTRNIYYLTSPITTQLHMVIEQCPCYSCNGHWILEIGSLHCYVCGLDKE